MGDLLALVLAMNKTSIIARRTLYVLPIDASDHNDTATSVT